MWMLYERENRTHYGSTNIYLPKKTTMNMYLNVGKLHEFDHKRFSTGKYINKWSRA